MRITDFHLSLGIAGLCLAALASAVWMGLTYVPVSAQTATDQPEIGVFTAIEPNAPRVQTTTVSWGTITISTPALTVSSADDGDGASGTDTSGDGASGAGTSGRASSQSTLEGLTTK